MSEVYHVGVHATSQYLSWSTVIGHSFLRVLHCIYVIRYIAAAFLDANNSHFCNWSISLVIYLTHFYLTEGENNDSYFRELQVKKIKLF